MTGLAAFTLIHVALSLLGIGAGVVVMNGFMHGKQSEGVTVVFLSSTIAACVTGFGFPFVRFLPAHAIGISSLLALGFALHARYARRLVGTWGSIYVLTSVIALYFNVFIAVAQLFRRVPALHALAPTESEPPFLAAELAVLVLFAWLGRSALRGFRVAPRQAVGSL
jgi:hypothetical protein